MRGKFLVCLAFFLSACAQGEAVAEDEISEVQVIEITCTPEKEYFEIKPYHKKSHLLEAGELKEKKFVIIDNGQLLAESNYSKECLLKNQLRFITKIDFTLSPAPVKFPVNGSYYGRRIPSLAEVQFFQKDRKLADVRGLTARSSNRIVRYQAGTFTFCSPAIKPPYQEMDCLSYPLSALEGEPFIKKEKTYLIIN